MHAVRQTARGLSSAAAPLRRTTKLKNMLHSKELAFIMEAHNGLSARLVAEAGFQGIWGSGLSISAAMGVRDCNEASWTQVLDVCEQMTDAAPELPLLLDADTGYGNFNNARRLIKKLESRGVAGCCIEDKIFPKANSLLGADQAQPLASIEEFAGKIEACKDTQVDPDFVVVARIESFIAGWGLEETLKRADAYAAAGADAVLIHSALNNPSEIEAFMKAWDQKTPVVIVPTKYHSTPTDHFRDMNVSLAIWANHNMRASVDAMRKCMASIKQNESINEVEGWVTPVKEVFELTGMAELKAAEKKFLR